MNVPQAISEFFNGFGLKAYEENSVPDDAVLPYITHQVVFSGFRDSYVLSASVWTQETTWNGGNAYAQAIFDKLAGGYMMALNNGGLWLKRGTPFATFSIDPDDDTIKRIQMNIEIEFLNEV